MTVEQLAQKLIEFATFLSEDVIWNVGRLWYNGRYRAVLWSDSGQNLRCVWRRGNWEVI
jgi:hypothetical protein